MQGKIKILGGKTEARLALEKIGVAHRPSQKECCHEASSFFLA
jgi:hypothetical protein